MTDTRKLTLTMPSQNLIDAAKIAALQRHISVSAVVAAFLERWAAEGEPEGDPGHLGCHDRLREINRRQADRITVLEGVLAEVAMALGLEADPAADLQRTVRAAAELNERAKALLAENTAQFHRIRALEKGNAILTGQQMEAHPPQPPGSGPWYARAGTPPGMAFDDVIVPAGSLDEIAALAPQAFTRPLPDEPGYHGEGELADYDPGTGRSSQDDWGDTG